LFVTYTGGEKNTCDTVAARTVVTFNTARPLAARMIRGEYSAPTAKKSVLTQMAGTYLMVRLNGWTIDILGRATLL
jgi:hypothetical protein